MKQHIQSADRQTDRQDKSAHFQILRKKRFEQQVALLLEAFLLFRQAEVGVKQGEPKMMFIRGKLNGLWIA